jgi:hypothetical protein
MTPPASLVPRPLGRDALERFPNFTANVKPTDYICGFEAILFAVPPRDD